MRLLFAASIAAALAAPAPAGPKPAATWTKTVLDTKFRSEGVAVADVNRDGKADVLTGEHWYEAPGWTPHEMQPAMDHGTGERNYSRVFACWAEDLNADGYPDLIVIDFPGKPCYWMENPKGRPTHWRKHEVWHSACNETPLYTDLLGFGKRVLVMGSQPQGRPETANEGQMGYFAPNPKDPYAKWVMHPVSEPGVPPEVRNGRPVPNTGRAVPGTMRFSHGLGVGDVNGDGRNDVITTGGWWQQPASPGEAGPWKFHPANLGEACADMYAYDVDGDGKNDVLSTSAHKFGVWWHKQGSPADAGAPPSFRTATLFGMLSSETHAAHFVDLDRDGQKDLVTGKRWWSHGRSEPGHGWAARVYLLKGKKEADGFTSFTPHVIDEDSGVGTQFAVADVNGDGLPDVVSSNKKGVRVIVQGRK